MSFSKAQCGRTPNSKPISFGSYILALTSDTKYHQAWESIFMPSVLFLQDAMKTSESTTKTFYGCFCLPGKSVTETESTFLGDVSHSSYSSCSCYCSQFNHKPTSSAISVMHSCGPNMKSSKQSEISQAIRCDRLKKLN